MTLFELIQQAGLAQQEGISSQQIDAYQRRLFQAGLANIPLSYVHLLEKMNGIQTDTLALFGIGLSKSFVRDIAEVNSVGGVVQNERIFLGDNFNEYLIYDWSLKSYVVIAKDSSSDKRIFSLLEEALPYFLRDYLKNDDKKRIVL